MDFGNFGFEMKNVYRSVRKWGKGPICKPAVTERGSHTTPESIPEFRHDKARN